MIEKIRQLIAEVEAFGTDSPERLEEFRVKLFGKKGEITVLFEQFKEVPPRDKKAFGQELNLLKTLAISKLKDIQEKLKKSFKVDLSLDLTLPGDPMPLGSRHPVSLVKNQIIDIFSRLGFTISTGPEIEDDWHVFSALNFPPEHPARDMQDTFFIEQDPDILLRTHTSPVQVRVMEKQKPPIRTISPGRVFRNEAISARSHCIFHQVEGLYIDRRVSFTDLKQTLLFFSKEMFGQDTRIRLRPSFFPFTEPSAEMDVSCTLCGGKGCNVCKYTGWLEILGCGMVDPNVLDNVGIDSQEFTGFAFGMGIERIALLKFGIKDIRLLFENDVRFLRQFTGAL
ncbi:MAG: phenylalanine--tRNA ligase subunit alpha [Bacteroidales bacterium]